MLTSSNAAKAATTDTYAEIFRSNIGDTSSSFEIPTQFQERMREVMFEIGVRRLGVLLCASNNSVRMKNEKFPPPLSYHTEPRLISH